MKVNMDKLIDNIGSDRLAYDPNSLPNTGSSQLVTQVEIRDAIAMLRHDLDEESKRNKRRFVVTTILSTVAAVSAAAPLIPPLLRIIVSLF